MLYSIIFKYYKKEIIKMMYVILGIIIAIASPISCMYTDKKVELMRAQASIENSINTLPERSPVSLISSRFHLPDCWTKQSLNTLRMLAENKDLIGTSKEKNTADILRAVDFLTHVPQNASDIIFENLLLNESAREKFRGDLSIQKALEHYSIAEPFPRSPLTQQPLSVFFNLNSSQLDVLRKTYYHLAFKDTSGKLSKKEYKDLVQLPGCLKEELKSAAPLF